MTQPEDDAARLAREISDMLICDLATDACGNLVYDSDAKSPIAEIIRARLAERDARERMVREELENLKQVAKGVCYVHELQPSNDNRELENKYIRLAHADAIQALRAALSAKSDEQTEAG